MQKDLEQTHHKNVVVATMNSINSLLATMKEELRINFTEKYSEYVHINHKGISWDK